MKPSQTAMYVAFFRALETMNVQREPLFRDPWARYFLPRRFRLTAQFARQPHFRAVIERYMDEKVPGARASVIGRTRYIDDVIREESSGGCAQLVILGAGFDCRAHRMLELSRTTVFEVDRAQTQAYKRRIMQRHKSEAQALVYVEVDFQRDDLRNRLAQCGWDNRSRTIFVWEGVTSYLTKQAVEDVFTFVGQAVAGSTLVFTYLHRDVIQDPDQVRQSADARDYVHKLGEPWTYGIDPRELETLLSGFDLRLEDDLGADEYPQRYGLGGELRGYSFNRIARAKVA